MSSFTSYAEAAAAGMPSSSSSSSSAAPAVVTPPPSERRRSDPDANPPPLTGLHLNDYSSTNRGSLETEKTVTELPSSSSSSSGIITLNVGGKLFSTSKATLTSQKDTFFEALVSGRHGNPSLSTTTMTNCISSGSTYFIDRDPDHFKHILNFLRTGTVISLPTDENGKKELLIEADFYGLDNMAKAMQSPVIDVKDFLPPHVVVQQEKEKELRSAFVEGKSMTPHRGLISIFSEDHGLECPLMFEPNHPLRGYSSNLFLTNVRSDIEDDVADAFTPVTVESLEEFTTNFNKEHPNILHRIHAILQSEKVIIAGGSVLCALTSGEEIRTGGEWWGETSDIDMFLYDVGNDEAERIVRRIFQAVAVDQEKWAIVRAPGTINIHNVQETKIQIVLRIYDSPAEVLVGFDVDCCCCCYDGRDVWITPRCEHALRSGVNVLNPLHAWPRKASYELRLGKYASRGFPVYVPGIDKSQVDYDLINKTSLKDLKGLARFLKVVFELEPTIPTYDSWDILNQRFNRRVHPLRRVAGLREESIRTVSPDEVLVDVLVFDYDGDFPDNLLVPSVYGIENQGDLGSMAWAFGDLPCSSLTRDAAIEQIVNFSDDDRDDDENEDAHNPSPKPPRRLADAWEREKRSREYLNDEMDQIDLDTMYYAGAYRTNTASSRKNQARS